jgi:ATP synthase protein I
MNKDEPIAKDAMSDLAFAAKVGTKAARKLKAQRGPTAVWFGLGMMGLVGWSVVIPTLLGAALGARVDKSHPGTHSWTLALSDRAASMKSYSTLSPDSRRSASEGRPEREVLNGEILGSSARVRLPAAGVAGPGAEERSTKCHGLVLRSILPAPSI